MRNSNHREKVHRTLWIRNDLRVKWDHRSIVCCYASWAKLSAHPDATALQGTPVDEPISCDASTPLSRCSLADCAIATQLVTVASHCCRNTKKPGHCAWMSTDKARLVPHRGKMARGGAAEVHAAVNPVRRLVSEEDAAQFFPFASLELENIDGKSRHRGRGRWMKEECVRISFRKKLMRRYTYHFSFNDWFSQKVRQGASLP